MRGIKQESMAKETLDDIVKPLIENGEYEKLYEGYKKEFLAELEYYKK